MNPSNQQQQFDQEKEVNSGKIPVLDNLQRSTIKSQKNETSDNPVDSKKSLLSKKASTSKKSRTLKKSSTSKTTLNPSQMQRNQSLSNETLENQNSREDIDDVDIKQYRREAKMLKVLIDKELDECKSVERLKENLHLFWLMEKKRSEDIKKNIENKQREYEDAKERQESEIKVYRKRLKHLLAHHQNQITNAKSQWETTLKVAQDESREKRKFSKQDKEDLKYKLNDLDLSHYNQIVALKHHSDEEITALRHRIEVQTDKIRCHYERKMHELRSSMTLQVQSEMKKIEDGKDAFVSRLMSNHQTAFGEIKNYFTDITHNNLDLIKNLKTQLAEKKTEEAKRDNVMFEIAQENKRTAEPLQVALMDIEVLRTQLIEAKKIKDQHKKVATDILLVQDAIKDYEWKREVLQQRFNILRKERDDLYDYFEAAVFEMQQKNNFKQSLLEKKLKYTQQDIEKKQHNLQHILPRSGIPSNFEQDILQEKDATIAALLLEFQKITALSEEVKEKSKKKLNEYGCCC